MVNRPDPKERLQAEIDALRDEVTLPAHEVLEQLYAALLAVPEFTLKNGAKAKVEAYYKPEINDEGEVICGVDVRLDNGNLLEFTMHNSGWEKSFVESLGKQRADDTQRNR